MDTQEIRDLVEDTTRHHGAPWKRVVSSDGGFYGVTDRNGSVVAGSPAVTALIAQAPTLIPELLDRLEQAEQAVAGVREVVNTKWFPTYALDDESPVVTTEDILRALDGVQA